MALEHVFVQPRLGIRTPVLVSRGRWMIGEINVVVFQVVGVAGDVAPLPHHPP